MLQLNCSNLQLNCSEKHRWFDLDIVSDSLAQEGATSSTLHWVPPAVTLHVGQFPKQTGMMSCCISRISTISLVNLTAGIKIVAINNSYKLSPAHSEGLWTVSFSLFVFWQGTSPWVPSDTTVTWLSEVRKPLLTTIWAIQDMIWIHLLNLIILPGGLGWPAFTGPGCHNNRFELQCYVYVVSHDAIQSNEFDAIQSNEFYLESTD